MRISSWISDVCSSYLALQFVEQGIDVAAQPVEFGDTERLHPLVEAAVQPHVMRDGRDFIERLDELIFEPPRQENRAECGDQQAGQSGEQAERSEEHTSELQSLMRISYAVFCLKKKKNTKQKTILVHSNNE